MTGEALARLGALRAALVAAGWESGRVAAAVTRVVAGGFVEAVAAGDGARLEQLLAGPLGEVSAAAGPHAAR